MKAGAPELSGKKSWIGLSYAADSEQAELVKTVLGLGADAPKARHRKWSEPRFRAFRWNHSQTVRLPDAVGADDFEARDTAGGVGGGVGDARGRAAGAAGERLREGPLRALRRKGATLGIFTVLLVAALAPVPLLGVELMPETDEGRIDLNVELPVGTPLETTMASMQEVERRVRGALKDGELEHLTTVAGPEAAWRPGSSNEGSMEVMLVPVTRRNRSIDEMLAAVRKATSGIPGRGDPRAQGHQPTCSSGSCAAEMTACRSRSADTTSTTADRLAERVRKVLAERPGSDRHLRRSRAG